MSKIRTIVGDISENVCNNSLSGMSISTNCHKIEIMSTFYKKIYSSIKFEPTTYRPDLYSINPLKSYANGKALLEKEGKLALIVSTEEPYSYYIKKITKADVIEDGGSYSFGDFKLLSPCHYDNASCEFSPETLDQLDVSHIIDIGLYSIRNSITIFKDGKKVDISKKDYIHSMNSRILLVAVDELNETKGDIGFEYDLNIRITNPWKSAITVTKID